MSDVLTQMSKMIRRQTSNEMPKTLITSDNLIYLFNKLYAKYGITLVFPKDGESNHIHIYYNLQNGRDEAYLYHKQIPFYLPIFMEDLEEQVDEFILSEMPTIEVLRDRKLIQRLEEFNARLDKGTKK